MKKEFSVSVLQLKQELAYRIYSSRTITNYCECMMALETRLNKPLDQISESELKSFLHYLLVHQKNQHRLSTKISVPLKSIFRMYSKDHGRI